MDLAIFDLDNTLLEGDSDYSWGCFLADKGVVDGSRYRRENARFYEAYKAGTLDIHEFLAFSLKPLADTPIAELYRLRTEFMQTRIEPLIRPKAEALIDRHRQRGDHLLIITATNHFVTEPIARRLGIDDLLATDPETVDGRFTGRVAGTPCFGEGKVKRFRHWAANTHKPIEQTWFYSDSHNDIPLLEQATFPVAVDPDAKLAAYARKQNWPSISLRDDAGSIDAQVLIK